MINASNILTYIKFLYQKKYEKVAPAQLLSQWRSVPEHQIQTELQKLYAHWEWSVSKGREKEEEFIKLSEILLQKEVVKQEAVILEAAAPKETAKRKGGWLKWFSPLLLLALAYGIYTNYEREDNVTNAQEKTNGTLLQEPAQEPTAIDVPIIEQSDIVDENEAPVAEAETMNDKLNKANIRSFIFAEDARDLEALYALLSPNIYKYYDLDYPTQNQLRNRYEHIWEITKDNTNYIDEIKKVDAGTYEVKGNYEYFGLKTAEIKRLATHLRYEMDNDNKIISVDVVK